MTNDPNAHVLNFMDAETEERANKIAREVFGDAGLRQAGHVGNGLCGDGQIRKAGPPRNFAADPGPAPDQSHAAQNRITDRALPLIALAKTDDDSA
jgi:hypothetical protein